MHIKGFVSKRKPRNRELKELEKEVLDSSLSLLEGRDMVYKAFPSGIFPRREELQQEVEGFKILTTNKILRRLPIVLAQIRPGNNSKSLLNEIRQIVYSLYRS